MSHDEKNTEEEDLSTMDMPCVYCAKLCKGLRGLTQHETHCKVFNKLNKWSWRLFLFPRRRVLITKMNTLILKPLLFRLLSLDAIHVLLYDLVFSLDTGGDQRFVLNEGCSERRWQRKCLYYWHNSELLFSPPYLLLFSSCRTNSPLQSRLIWFHFILFSSLATHYLSL